MTPGEYEKLLADRGLHYGVICEHNGMINEGAYFMFIAPADSPWVTALVLRGDFNNFSEGQISNIHCGLRPVEEAVPAWPTGWGLP